MAKIPSLYKTASGSERIVTDTASDSKVKAQSVKEDPKSSMEDVIKADTTSNTNNAAYQVLRDSIKTVDSYEASVKQRQGAHNAKYGN